MKTVLALSLAASFLFGCSSSPAPAPQERGRTPGNCSCNLDLHGAEVAAELTWLYRDTRPDCGQSSWPAFLCTGIFLRGTDKANGFDVWDPSPTAIRVGGTSFSWVRYDYWMQRLAIHYNKGFILYPVFGTPAGKEKLQILCFFPVDGVSDMRSDRGCGVVQNAGVGVDVRGTVPCAQQGIHTGAQWAAHYRAYSSAGHNYLGVCSFNVRDELNQQAGPNFYQGIIGGRAVAPTNYPNDVKVKTWAPGLAKTLPIKAFFYYVRDGVSGLADVQIDQRRFKELTGICLPIIKATFPQNPAEKMTFVYQPADQAIN